MELPAPTWARKPTARRELPEGTQRRGLRILVLHQHYWPEIAATAQLLSDLCEDLALRGHHVKVVCGHPSYRKLEGSGTVPVRETHLGVDVHRVWSYVPD